MKHLLITLCAGMLLIIGCAKDNPVAPPLNEPTIIPYITIISPALAWWDMSDSLFYVQINKKTVGAVADTASLWITAYTGGAAYHTEYFGYKTGTWSWVLDDSFTVYRPADSVKMQLTYWFNSGTKETVDMMTTVRLGAK